MGKSRAFLIGLVVAGSLGFGVGAMTTSGAASSTSAAVFYGCSNQITGAVTNISTKVATCGKGANSVSWNAAGQTGASGTSGLTGYYLSSTKGTSCIFVSTWVGADGARQLGVSNSLGVSATYVYACPFNR